MRQSRLAVLGVAGGFLFSWAAWAGEPDPTLSGPTRGSSIHLAYYPATPRAAGMGGATVALPGVDSHNPAAWAFYQGYDAAFDYGRLRFRHGPDIDIARSHLVFPALGGTMKLMGYGMRSDRDERSRMLGMDAEVRAHELGVGYGREIKLPEGWGRLAIGGAGFPYDPSGLRLRPHGGGDVFARGRGMSRVGSARLGVLYEPEPHVSFGLQFDHIIDRLSAHYPGIPFHVGERRDDYVANIVTVGVAVRPPIPALSETTVLTAQYLTGGVHGENLDYHPHIPAIGLEHQVFKWLAVRVGALYSHPTAGLGLKLPHGWRVDYAYLHDYGKDIRSAFGVGPLHILGVGREF